MPKNVVLMEIEQVTWELEDTKTLRLKWPKDYAVSFQTGQFITLYWPDAPKYKRAYSLSSSALEEASRARVGAAGDVAHSSRCETRRETLEDVFSATRRESQR